jgi:hypothetical protein
VVARRQPGDVERQAKLGAPLEEPDGKLERAPIDEPRQSELLGDDDELARRDDRAVGAVQAQKGLVERGQPRARRDDRLQHQPHAILAQRGDDLVGDRDVALAPSRAGRARLVGHEAVEPLLPRALEGLQGMAQRLLGARGLVGEQDAADRDGRRDRADARRDRRLARRRDEALRRRPHRDRAAAAVQKDRELVGRVAAHRVAAAQPRPQQARRRRDHLVADIEAERLVDDGQVVDRGHQQRGGPAARQHGAQRAGQGRAVELTRQLVAVAAVELALRLDVAVCEHAQDAARTRRPPVRAGPPAAVLLDPDRAGGARAAGLESIVQAIGCAGGVDGWLRRGQHVVTALDVLRRDAVREGRAGRDLGARAAEDLGRVAFPGQPVGREIPVVGGLAHGRQDADEVEWARVAGPWPIGDGRRIGAGRAAPALFPSGRHLRHAIGSIVPARAGRLPRATVETTLKPKF